MACPIFCTNEIVSVAQLLKGPVFLYQGLELVIDRV